MTKKLLVAAVLLVVGFLAFAWVIWPLLLPSLIYAPRPLQNGDRTPQRWGYEGQEVSIPVPGGEPLHGWYLRSSRPSHCTVLFLHGNAGNVASQAGFMRPFLAAGLDALVFDYRGYGASKGRPSEAGLYEDAAAAFDYVAATLGTGTNRVLLVGHSLGTAVATHVAAEREAAALVLAAPFTSLRHAVEARVPAFPSSALRWPREHFDSGSRMNGIAERKLFVFGKEDRLVPAASARTLYEAAGEPKRAISVPGGHNQVLDSEAFSRELDLLLRDLPQCGPDTSSAGQSDPGR